MLDRLSNIESKESAPIDVPQNYSVTRESTSCKAKQKTSTFPENLTGLVYKYAEEALLKGIAVGSRAFKNYLKHRININNISDEMIETAINNTDYSQLKERYIRDGKLIAKESQKYTLTVHAKERISKPELDNVTPLFRKYMSQAEQAGIKKEKKILSYLQENIKTRNIPIEIVSDAIDTGKCVKLPGKKKKYTKGGITVIVSHRDHSIITAYCNYTNKNHHTFYKTSCSSNKSANLSTEDKQVISSKMAESLNIKVNELRLGQGS